MCDKCGKILNKDYEGSYLLIEILDTNEEMICCNNNECWEEKSYQKKLQIYMTVK